MNELREQRVAEAIREELSEVLRTQMRDPRLGFVSITAVDVSSDLSIAKVSVSVLGEEKERKQALQAIKKARGFLRSELAQRMRLRFMPELVFKIDTSIEHSLRIAKLLNEISEHKPEKSEDKESE